MGATDFDRALARAAGPDRCVGLELTPTERALAEAVDRDLPVLASRALAALRARDD